MVGAGAGLIRVRARNRVRVRYRVRVRARVSTSAMGFHDPSAPCSRQLLSIITAPRARPAWVRVGGQG